MIETEEHRRAMSALKTRYELIVRVRMPRSSANSILVEHHRRCIQGACEGGIIDRVHQDDWGCTYTVHFRVQLACQASIDELLMIEDVVGMSVYRLTQLGAHKGWVSREAQLTYSRE